MVGWTMIAMIAPLIETAKSALPASPLSTSQVNSSRPVMIVFSPAKIDDSPSQ